MVADSRFDIDLAYGVAREDALAAVLRRGTVEVKSDRGATTTGNVFVEYEYRGRPSGIAVTQADWWAFETAPERFTLIRTDELRALARRVYRARGPVRGGDDLASRGVLVRVSELTGCPDGRSPREVPHVRPSGGDERESGALPVHVP